MNWLLLAFIIPLAIILVIATIPIWGSLMIWIEGYEKPDDLKSPE